MMQSEAKVRNSEKW